jgi:hypothetical protein
MTTARLTSRVLHAEWTKLWTVRRWAAGLAAAALLSVLFGLLAANGTQDNTNQRTGLIVGPQGLVVQDSFRFVHRPLTGDGSIVAQVASQHASQPGAAAGIMVKTSTTPGSSYAALMVTSGHGVRLSANFGPGTGAGPGAAPVWLRLTRAGAVITARRSADGVTWRPVGTVRLVRPAGTVQVGLFVTSPPKTVVTKTLSATSAGETATTSQATFDHVRVTGAAAGTWAGETIGHTDVKPPAPGSSTQAGGLFTVTGSGAIGSGEGPDDPIQNSLFGLFFGVLVLIPVAVLFMTSEYRRPLILATFGASPRRRRVLAAKASVIGAASFGTGLTAALATYLITRPLFQARGFRPPAFAYTFLGQPAVLRAVIGSAVLAGALGVLSMAVAALVRRGAATIAIVVALFVLPVFVAAPLPLTAARWLVALTPAGGLAIQRTKPPTDTLAEPWSMLSPWLGLAVVCGYAAAALALAMWRVERRDA